MNEREEPQAPKRCDRCFGEKSVQLLFPPIGIACCKSCRYKLGDTIDFLEYYGLRIIVPEPDPGTSNASEATDDAVSAHRGDDNPPTPRGAKTGPRRRAKKTG